MFDKQYKLYKPSPQESLRLMNLKRKYKNIPELTLKYIVANNIENEEEYLYPTIDKMDDPYKMKDLKEAVPIIIEKLKTSPDKILIVGDYDVDGMTSASILKLYFRERFGKEIEVYIPERVEGYGLSKNIIDYALKRKKDFIITTDNGIAAFEPVEYAKSKNITVIITDHHPLSEGKMPKADFVINPKRKDCEYRDKNICGAGVAFNLVRGIAKYLGERIDYDLFLPILAIGTVADVVPLIGDNRIFVKNGFKRKIKNKGLVKLLERLGISLNSTNVAFGVAPVLNSAGREGYARLGYRLFVEEDEKTLEWIIDTLIKFNELRKTEQRETETFYLNKIEKEGLNEKHKCFVLYDDKYSPNSSIVGIVASKIVNKYNRPVIVLTKEIVDFWITPEGEILNKGDIQKINNEHEIIKLGESLVFNSLTIKNKTEIKSLIPNKQKQKEAIEQIKEKYNILEKKETKGYIKIKAQSKFAKGSGRSVFWYDFKNLISELKKEDLLINGGGHSMAMGLTVKEEDIPKIQKIADKIASPQPLIREILEIIDLPEDKTAAKMILKRIREAIDYIEPIGEGNKQPVLAYDIGLPAARKIFGVNKNHVSLKTMGGINVIGFDKKNDIETLSDKLIIGEILENRFINKEGEEIKYLQIKIEDVVKKKDLLF